MRKIDCPSCEKTFRAQINQEKIYCPFCGEKFQNKIYLREASKDAIYDELTRRGIAFKIFGEEETRRAGVGLFKFSSSPNCFKHLSEHADAEDWVVVAPKNKYHQGEQIVSKMARSHFEVHALDTIVVFITTDSII